jgi:hypothetical protein
MNTVAKIIASVAFLSLLAAPASARFDSDEGGLSAYPQFGAERGTHSQAPATLVNRPNR